MYFLILLLIGAIAVSFYVSKITETPVKNNNSNKEVVDNNFINKALDELIENFGLHDYIDDSNQNTKLFNGDYKTICEEIAKHLNLPINVRIIEVSSKYDRNTKTGFQSSGLVNTEPSGGSGETRGTHSIFAQISIPVDLPMYQSDRMNGFTIDIKLSDSCNKDVYNFITVIAHELSHVVLYSSWNKYKENEYYTDLTPIVFGFGKIIEKGRKQTSIQYNSEWGDLCNTTHTYGYLSDGNFIFALNKIEGYLNKFKISKNLLNKNLSYFNEQLQKIRDNFSEFDDNIKYLDNNLGIKIRQNDALKITEFHQYGYVENYKNYIQPSSKLFDKISKFNNDLKSYKKSEIEKLKSIYLKSKQKFLSLKILIGRLRKTLI